MFQYSWLYVLNRISIGICNFTYHMRFIIISAIDNRRKCRYHFNHCHIISLPKRRCRKLCWPHRTFIKHQAGRSCLSRQINIGFQANIKNLLKLYQIFYADCFPHLHKSDIAGLFQRSAYIKGAMPPSDIASNTLVCYL